VLQVRLARLALQVRQVFKALQAQLVRLVPQARLVLQARLVQQARRVSQVFRASLAQ
jgi:hypothetical protein